MWINFIRRTSSRFINGSANYEIITLFSTNQNAAILSFSHLLQPGATGPDSGSRPRRFPKPFNPSRSFDETQDNPEESRELDDPNIPSTGRRQPPPPPKDNRYKRPPPPLPTDIKGGETQPQTIINRNELEEGAELGQGEFGSVLRGVWSNPNGNAVNICILIALIKFFKWKF